MLSDNNQSEHSLNLFGWSNLSISLNWISNNGSWLLSYYCFPWFSMCLMLGYFACQRQFFRFLPFQNHIEEPSTAEVLSQHLLAAAELAIVHQKQLENFRVWISTAAVQGKPFSPDRSRKLWHTMTFDDSCHLHLSISFLCFRLVYLQCHL